MQTLYLMRGPQGSGKSTFLMENGLDPWTLSKDHLRLITGSVEMNNSGIMTYSHSNDEAVHLKFIDILSERMSKGHTTFVDVTHMSSNFSKYADLAHRWAYSVKVIEFGVGMTVEQLSLRVQSRLLTLPYHNVPSKSIEKAVKMLEKRNTPDWIESITPEQAILEINASTQDMTSQYNGLLFIGDIQGCATPLKKLLDDVDTSDKLIVFTGDLFDRGIENDEVMLIAKSLLEDGRARLICGNHERHILSWRHRQSTPGEFRYGTLPQIKKAGFNDDVADFFISRMENIIQLQHGSTMIQVTHGGAPNVINKPALFPGYQCWKGVGHYSDDVDLMFERNAPDGWYQVHGHRNMLSRDLAADQRSFNLDGGVEFGGNLRALSFDGERFSPIEIKNKVFLPISQQNIKYNRLVPEWILEQNKARLSKEEAIEPCLISSDGLNELRQHDLVKESVQSSMPHISSFNFTREAFYSQSYDSCNMRARGLYINTESREVVIRGYDKYFNVNERGIPSASLDHILSTTSAPYRAAIKENGYLGLIGYDSHADELVYATKSTVNGDHATWLKDQIESRLNKTQLMDLRRILRDCQLSLAFEVIEPEKDPHIIEYDQPNVILLDGIRRSMEFKRINYDELQTLARIFSFDTKQLGPTIHDKSALTGFLHAVTETGFKHKGEETEGLVIEDKDGTMFKVKLPYYNLWKHARSASQAVKRFHEKGSPIKPHFTENPVIALFVQWLLGKDESMAGMDIISLRKLFLSEHPEYADSVSMAFQIKPEKA